MRFLVEVAVSDPDGGDPFPQEQVRAWLENYVLATDVMFEIADDPVRAGSLNEHDGQWSGRNAWITSRAVEQHRR